MKKFFSLLISLCLFFLTGCHDSIFEGIENEVALDKNGVRGSMSSIVEIGNTLYIATMSKEKIFYKDANDTSNAAWNSMSAPRTPVAISNFSSTLYIISVDWVEGSGDWEGYNMPKFFEYKLNGSSWDYTGYSCNYGDTPSFMSKYKDQLCTAGNYSINKGTSNRNFIMYNSSTIKTFDSDTLTYIYSIAKTNNTVLIGTDRGLYSLAIGSGGSLGSPTHIVGGKHTEELLTTSCDVPIVYVPSCFSSNDENQAVIYAYNCPRGSGNTDKEGLMAQFQGSDWNRSKN